jgi:stress-induced-phosphoprotein 1
MTRHGNCLVKLGQLEAAIGMFQKALTEHRNADTLTLLRTTEKQLKDQQEAEYVDVKVAEEEKEAGNAAFAKQDYPAAVGHYSEALKRGPAEVWPEAHKVHSNRAACYTKLGALPEGAPLLLFAAPIVARWSDATVTLLAATR